MTLLIIGIIVAGIVLAVVLNKKKSPESHSAPAVAQDPNVTVVETASDLVPVVEEQIATAEQKSARKANATKQAAAKKPAAAAKKPAKKSK